MYISRIRSLCSIFGLVGLGFVTSFYSAGEARATKKTQISKPKREWPKDYEQTCYKWIFYGSNTKGELAACLDKNSSNTSSSNLIFVLWWLENNKSRFLSVDSIKVENNQISFKFTHSNRVKGMENKKLEIPSKNPNLKNNWKDLSKLNDQKLKDICSLSGNNLSCRSVGYETETRKITWYF